MEVGGGGGLIGRGGRDIVHDRRRHRYNQASTIAKPQLHIALHPRDLAAPHSNNIEPLPPNKSAPDPTIPAHESQTIR